MVCHECGRAVERGDRYCTGCGASLRGITDTTEMIAAVDGEDDTVETTGDDTTDDATDADPPVSAATIASDESADDGGWVDGDPVWAATGPLPATRRTATSELPATEPITEVRPAERAAPEPEQTAVATAPPTESAPYDFVAHEETTVAPTTVPPTAQMAAVPSPVPPPPGHRFRFGAVLPIGIVSGIVTMVAMFATVVAVESDTRLTIGPDAPVAFRTGTWILDDLAGNLSIAGLIAVLAMVAGAVASAFGWRWGSGLAGGGGLATAGLAALAIGLAQVPIDAATEFASIPNEQRFTLTITRDLGYWLLIVAAALGIVVFFASINDALADRRPGLNPWIAALGALAAVITAGGPLIPENLAVFSDNWFVDDSPGAPPALLLAGRLAQLALLVVAGLAGFLAVRRWGLGVAIGGALPIVWLAVSTLFELTDDPVGPGYANPGSPGFSNPGAGNIQLHGVTIIGVSALLAMAVLAVIAAYDQGVRERP